MQHGICVGTFEVRVTIAEVEHHIGHPVASKPAPTSVDKTATVITPLSLWQLIAPTL
jgi:hypothetical protein